MRLIRTYLFLFVMIIAMQADAQDVHFSQFYATPLAINPAQTGWFEGDYRVGLNYKNQWPWGNLSERYTYRSLSFWGDYNYQPWKWRDGNHLGFGAVMVNDRAGDGQLSTTKVFIQAAHHLVFGPMEQLELSYGLTAGYIQKSIDFEQLYFNSQWDDVGFDTDIPSGEAPTNEDIRYIDLGLGLNLAYTFNTKYKIYAGTGLFHLNKPKDSFYDTDNRLGIRPVITGGAIIQPNGKWSIEPSFAYEVQKRAFEVLMGVMAGYNPGFERVEGMTFMFGTHYRSKDALVPVAGLRYRGVQLLVNYDVNLSSLTEASRGNGGVEFSLIYTHGSTKSKSSIPKIPCPRI